MRVECSEVELEYEVWDGGSPPVVFLHGIGSQHGMYAPLVPVRGDLKAFAYDARGHGQSGRASTYRFGDYGSDAIEFIERAVQEPAILVGHSLGGMCAVMAAAERPDLVIAAVLIDPPLYHPENGLGSFEEGFRRVEAIAGQPYETVLEQLASNGMPAAFARSISMVDRPVFSQLLEGTAVAGWDTDALLRRIECPVLLEYGEPAFGSALAAGEPQRAAALLQDCTLFELTAAGHGFFERADRLLPVVTEFIQRAGASRKRG